ncbi:hypothetical protein SNEBB_011086, partial [Seison nebaliae]
FAEQLAIYMEEDQHLNRVLQEVANIGEEKVIRPINDPREPMEFFNHEPRERRMPMIKCYQHPFITDLRQKIEPLSQNEPFLPLCKRNTVIHLKPPVCRWGSLCEMEVMRFLRIKDISLPCRYRPPIQIDNAFMRKMEPLQKNNGFLFMPPKLTPKFLTSFAIFKTSPRGVIHRFYNIYSWATHSRLWGTYEFRKKFFFEGEEDYDDKKQVPTLLKNLGSMAGENGILRLTLYLMARYFVGEAFTKNHELDMSENYDIFYVSPFKCREIKAAEIDPNITPLEFNTLAANGISKHYGIMFASREFLFLLRSVDLYLNKIADYITENSKILKEGGRKVDRFIRAMIIKNPAFLPFIEFYFDPENAVEVINIERNYDIAIREAMYEETSSDSDESSSDSDESSS